MILPIASEPEPELESAIKKLDITSDHPSTQLSQVQPQQPLPLPRQPQISPSHEEVWYLKSIDFTSPSGVTRSYNIITQNYNGPCSFIAICNILILREQIEISPPGRKSVSFEFLAQLVGEHILLTTPDVDVSAALSMMPLTTAGMDLNPVFTSCTAFRPATTGGELALFASAGITLVHGWLVDPESPEYAPVSRVQDYDSAVNLIVEADVLTRGLLVGNGAEENRDGVGPSQTGPSNSNINLTDEERKKVEEAMAIRSFLDNTRSQLTYTGLFTLASLPPQPSGLSKTAPISEPVSSRQPDGSTTAESAAPPHPELFALFRNSHLAVLYRHGGSLYTLATDQVFMNEPSVVWERLEDVDQGGAVFVDSIFERATPIGGDWAGWTPPSDTLGTIDPVDHALALELQNAEDEQARRAAQRRRELARHEERRSQEQEEKRKRAKKEDKECTVM
ncbi:hypothetical protein F5148DRAFT_1277295 [Russula earlei]|uniref:Uncharacterized protein n=1 Tax=Russula earlei TaxID=71964 RepID=A0ACC0TZK1_9AGAM|nr:hypothetical protein F5148DRAFT_1277295 [Russula earlei]